MGATNAEISSTPPSHGHDDPVADHRALGLTDEELASIVGMLGRPPTPLELAMFSVMWSEHCSYKSSRVHLRRLPTKADHVLVGPGENAGVIDVGDGIALALRIESHNHPSAIEPYQGATTGVGGILRDIFTMGARPIALMDPLFMGPLEDPRSRWVLDGVVRGIAGYGNSVGVPTVGGEITFSPCYAGNPLVNVFSLGLLPVERLVRASASGPGNVAVLLGARTGRDGIGGVSVLASAGFAAADGNGPDPGAQDAAKRPSVQVGDPFEEKRLIEACLELFDAGLVVGIQDLGGAGLTCAASETAARGGVGMTIDVTQVPLREPHMNAVEIMTSESQERMLALVTPENVERVHAVCRRLEVTSSVVGTVVPPEPDGTGMLRVRGGPGGSLLAEVPARALADDAPLLERPLRPPPDRERRSSDSPASLVETGRCDADLLTLVEDAAWIYSQYDHQLFRNTVVGPGAGDATVLRVAAPGVGSTTKAIALSTDSNPGWCAIDPRAGTAATVAESALNVACAGGRPLALVNCLNFGNPEHPEVMWQLSESIDGMSEACRVLSIPVVGGNVSLYNESGGGDIDPTPVVAIVGLIDELSARPPGPALAAGASLVLLGRTVPELGGSRWARELHAHYGGVLAPLDLEQHRRLLELVVGLARQPGDGLVVGLHDVSGGGLGVCLAEMAVRSRLGLRVEGVSGPAELFAESPSRVVICSSRPDELVARAQAAGIEATTIGTAGGERLEVIGLVDLGVAEIATRAQSRLRRAMDVIAR